MEKKKAMVAVQGIKEECELLEIVNNTAVILFKGNRTMVNKKDIVAVNAEAKKALGQDPGEAEEVKPNKAPAKKKAAKNN